MQMQYCVILANKVLGAGTDRVSSILIKKKRSAILK